MNSPQKNSMKGKQFFCGEFIPLEPFEYYIVSVGNVRSPSQWSVKNGVEICVPGMVGTHPGNP